MRLGSCLPGRIIVIAEEVRRLAAFAGTPPKKPSAFGRSLSCGDLLRRLFSRREARPTRTMSRRRGRRSASTRARSADRGTFMWPQWPWRWHRRAHEVPRPTTDLGLRGTKLCHSFRQATISPVNRVVFALVAMPIRRVQAEAATAPRAEDRVLAVDHRRSVLHAPRRR